MQHAARASAGFASLALLALGALSACGSNAARDGGPEPDASIDAGGDAGGDVLADAETPRPCESNLDCRGGEVCRAGTCREACGSNDDCTGALPVCDEVAGVCVACLDDGDCDEGRCVDTVCVSDRCETDDDCEGALTCDPETGRCGVCDGDGDCPGGYTCEDGGCVAIDDRICIPDTTRCEGDVLYTCSRDGTRETATACADADALCAERDGVAACLPVVCEPDAIGCLDANTAFVCDATGTTQEPLPCRADQYCDAGACRLRVCDPGARTCDGDVVVVCDERGASSTLEPCAAQADCADAALGCACVEAECRVRQCLPGGGRCVGALLQACEDDGLGYAAPAECPDDTVCLAGACIPDECTPGATRCAGDTLLRCEAGNRWTTTDCAASGQLCTTSGEASVCGARVCTPLAVACVDIETLGVCDARGATLLETACDDGQFCVDDACVEVACDPRPCDAFGVGETQPDVDGDGISDCEEALIDTDRDGTPDCADTDSDNDGITDRVEGRGNPDGDSLPNYRDDDSDGDGISDRIEGERDTDGVGAPDRLSTDSDGDGWTDRDESGRADVDAPPVDTDRDGTPDYRDPDSDNDGLGDADELGCVGSTDRLLADSDDDDWGDAVELAVGSDACDGDETPEDLADIVWRPTRAGETATFRVTASFEMARRDIAYSLDTTGSMTTSITAARGSASAVASAVALTTPDPAFGLAEFRDFPCSALGSPGDLPFELVQRVTTSVSAFTAGFTPLSAASGGDGPESGYEALYQIATGAGVSACSITVPPFNPAAGRVAGVADGTIGGLGFREGSLPVIVHITDNVSRDGPTVGAAAATVGETYAALQDIGARVVSVNTATSGTRPSVRTQLAALASETGAMIPTCAWGSTWVTRPAGCTAGSCCTGLEGASETPVSGMCPATVSLSSPSSTSMGQAVGRLLEAIARFGRFEATAEIRDPVPGGFDARSLITSVEPETASPPIHGCGVRPGLEDTDLDGANDLVTSAAWDASVTWGIELENTAPTGIHTVEIALVADGIADAGRITVLVIAP
jgi:hypothetical protein